MDKLRQDLIRRRQNVTDREEKEKAIVERLLPFFASSARVGAYVPVKGEANILGTGKVILFPRVCPDGSMVFAYPPLEKGYAGIPEPAGSQEEPDIVLVPLVAYSGLWRMGYGGGYYDRWIAAHPDVLTIGIAFEEQEHDFAVHAGDQMLDMLVTPAGILQKETLSERKRKYTQLLEAV